MTTTTTTTKVGFVDEATGEFTETGRTREQVVQEALDSDDGGAEGGV